MKKIQLEKNGRSILLTGVTEPNTTEPNKVITLSDEEFHKRLDNKTCDILKNNYTLPPPSPLVSMYIKYNVTLFHCKHNLNIKPPARYYRYSCNDYDIYYDNVLSSPNITEVHNFFSPCSVLQLPSKDITDTTDIKSFVSSQLALEVVLSDDCAECCIDRGGLCQLDSNKKFSCDKEEPNDRRKVRKLGLGIGLGLGIALLSILMIGFGCLFRRRYIQKHVPSDIQYLSRNTDIEESGIHFGIPLFSYKELKEATNNFHHTTQIGHGGFGIVYYGKLRDGREVAVKRLYENNYRRVEQFTNEIEILTRKRHANLVTLYGCTSRHSRELLLVYEYIPNGTVACHLHGDLARNGTLSWPIRMKIAIETASALAYLHASDIIHRDVKTNNILLDNNFTVKVADFGLSRLFPNDVTHVSTAPQGTPGYVDPEYHQCYQLTSKSDVYSFGVVLIELISSKPAVDMNRHKDEINLSNLAIKKIQQSALSELIDPSLGFDSDNEVKRMIVSVAELAFQCLQRDKELRPSMDEVLKVLMRIESGKDEGENVEEVNEHLASPSSPDSDEIGLLKNMKLPHSPRAVTDRWNSESTTPNASG
ncbi:hypothetical protein RIF29_43920 [Crotalaria pallida]|uniref:Protein kinase domain-containing protein n=1 Tax=Crotalaria pallida TaxID=3830 RepID=A0AAN9DVQ7_CROPI